MMISPTVQAFFDKNSNTFSYVVADLKTKKCAIIDSVLDYDAASAVTNTASADQIIAYVKAEKLQVEWILETHVHADHLTASQYLKNTLGGKVAMSEKISIVQEMFSKIYHVDLAEIQAQHPFDYLFKDGEEFTIGEILAYNIATPGHTPACLSYVIADTVFVGDTLFMPDYGTARCDFPKGDAAKLYDSVQKLFNLSEKTKVYLCHDYLPEKGRKKYQHLSTIAKQKKKNIHIHEGISKAEFIKMRNARDEKMPMPKLILPSIQINMRGGHFPPKEANGMAYLKLPLNHFKS